MTSSALVTARLRQVATIRPSNVDKKSLPNESPVRLCNYTDVYYNEDIRNNAEFMAATATPDQIATFTLRAGDVLITKDSESPDDIGVPAYVPDDLDGVLCGYHLSLIRPDTTHVHPRYLFWALKSAAVQSSMSAAALGITRFALRSIEVANLEVPLPKKRAQIQIADFLDRETARIDSLLGKKRVLAVMSHEQMASRITEMTEAREWSPVRLKYLLREQITDGPHETPEFVDKGIPFLSVDSIQDGQIVFDGCRYVTSEAYGEYARKCRPEKGDLLLTKAASIGKVAEVVTDNVFAVWSPLALLKPDHSKVSTRFLFFALLGRSVQEQMILASTSNTQSNLSMPDIGRLIVRLPALKDQKRIARALTQQWARRAQLVVKLFDSRQLLLQRRQALITAAVTGQMDLNIGAA